MIEEENSDNCEDSEYSHRKKNSRTNKKKLQGSESDKKSLGLEFSLDTNNLNLAFFNHMDKGNSKSEVPSNYINSFKPHENLLNLEKTHKISKSELCNLQVNMQKISEELERRIEEQEENSRIMKNIKKRLILDRLLKCSFYLK